MKFKMKICSTYFRLVIVVFRYGFYCNLSRNDSDVFKKRGMDFIHINVNSLLPKIDEVRYIYPDLNGNLLRKLPVAFNKFNNNSTKQYYINIEKSFYNFELCNATLVTTQKTLALLDTSKATSFDGISSKSLKDGAKV